MTDDSLNWPDMSRRGATFTQADVARVIRAAKQAGAKEVELRIGDQVITVRIDGQSTIPQMPLEDPEEIVL